MIPSLMLNNVSIVVIMSNVTDKIGELEDMGYLVFDPATDEGLSKMINYLKDYGYIVYREPNGSWEMW